MYVIEGTWEEIERRKAELIGRHLRVTVTPGRPVAPRKPPVPPKAASEPRRVSAMGKYSGILNTADLMREKQEEIDLEDMANR